MDKLSSLLNNARVFQNPSLQALAQQAHAHQKLQAIWQSIVPKELAQLSTAQTLQAEKLTVIAYSASAAAKIKLLNARLLTQLENLRETDPNYKECKVTAITVKVQVKSLPNTPKKTPRRVPVKAAAGLKSLANELGNSELAQQLLHLAENT